MIISALILNIHTYIDMAPLKYMKLGAQNIGIQENRRVSKKLIQLDLKKTSRNLLLGFVWQWVKKFSKESTLSTWGYNLKNFSLFCGFF